MSWLLSLQVSFCCQVHFAIYTSESTSVLLAVEQCCIYIFLASVWKPVLWVDQQITISTNLIILFFSFAKMSLRLVPEAVGWDASNTRRHSVLIELPFQTALQGMKFWTGFLVSISCCSGVRFLGLFPCLLYPAAISSSTIPFNGYWGNLTVIWSSHIPLNVASEPLNNGSFTWKIPWFDLTPVFPTPPIDIGIDDSCLFLILMIL